MQRRTDRSTAVAVVVSRYNASITDPLLEGARATYIERSGGEEGLTILHAPGAYELPALANAAARTGRFRGVVCLGCVIKGETSHDEYISHAVAQGLMQVTVQTGVPCAFGVLTVNTPEQAEARAGGKLGNKGAEAMHALLDTLIEIDALRENGGRNVRIVDGPAPGFDRSLPDKARRGRGVKK